MAASRVGSGRGSAAKRAAVMPQVAALDRAMRFYRFCRSQQAGCTYSLLQGNFESKSRFYLFSTARMTKVD